MSDNPTSIDKKFNYTARDQKGHRKKGQIIATDPTHAARKIRLDGLYPIDISLAKTVVATAKKRQSKRALTERQKADMVARLGKLTQSKINLDAALTIMADGNDGPIVHAANGLKLQMREGGGFAQALTDHVGVQDAATLALVHGAEISGDLPDALLTAADILQQRLMLKRRIMTGLMYPGLLLSVALISVGLIMIGIIPQFRPLVEDRMDMVPTLGRLVFGISAVLTASWPLMLTVIICAAIGFGIMHRRGKAVPILSFIVTRLPLIRDVIMRNQMMIVLHILGALLKREVTLSDALRVVSDTAPAGSVKLGLSDVSAQVEVGEALSMSLSTTDLLPSSAIEMVRIGEETGDLSAMVGRASAELRDAADRELERFLSIFQPALIVIVGLLVGVSLYALFSAIISVNSIAF